VKPFTKCQPEPRGTPRPGVIERRNGLYAWGAVSRKIVLWVFASGLLVFATLVAISLVLLRPAHIKSLVANNLARHLNLEASLEDVSLSIVPWPRLSGRGLTLRLPNRPDLPPFISIDHFDVDIGLLSALRKHVSTVHAGGLKIAVPPGDSRDELPGGDSTGGLEAASDIIVDLFVTHDAELSFVPRDRTRRPLVFAIHDLSVSDVGFNRAMPFDARLTNPVPRGLVEATGTIGPWLRENGTDTPVAGKYVFSDADLSTINGIGGKLASTGEFRGNLTAIAVTGEARVPDFSLDLGGRPAPLSSRFQAVVNGTDGTTYLKVVNATLRETAMTVSGAIENLAGPGRHDVKLDVHVPDGRIEDLLSLVLDSPEPIMVGDVVLKAALSLPPGPTRVRNRLRLQGSFGLAKTKFTDSQVQARLEELSRRSQGKRKEDPIGRVLTNLEGRFLLQNGRIALNDLTFQVPGATVRLDGTYDLASEALDFRGTLAMQATVSKAIGGFKSIFIKPFDGLFRKGNAGAVVPIKIEGTRPAPKFGIEMGKVFGKN
jgi:AsmA-like C-terminal region